MSGTEVQLCYGVMLGQESVPWAGRDFEIWWILENRDKLTLEPGMLMYQAFRKIGKQKLIEMVGPPPVTEVLCGVSGSIYERILAVPDSVERENYPIAFDPTKLIVNGEEVRLLISFCKERLQLKNIPDPEWYISFHQY